MALLASLILMLVCVASAAARAPVQLQRSIRLAAGGGGGARAGRARRLSAAAMAARGVGGRLGAPRMPAASAGAVSPLSVASPLVDAQPSAGAPASAFGGSGPQSGLRLLNSLSRAKEPFEPISGGRAVSWYICGPTVYDSAHLGHLRNYVGFDIVRRVLEGYFGYEVCYVMNVTDIDDKLIMRAHRRRLQAGLDALEGALVAEPALAPPASPLAAALEGARAALGGAEQSIGAVMAAQVQLRQAAAAAGGGAAALAAGGALRDCAPEADLVALAREFEAEFFADMRRVNVRPPTAVTRVTEYLPEIVQYIQTIEANGYCYAAPDGSVYFDTAAFSAKHAYGKLRPAENAEALLAEAEGALSAAGGAPAADGGAGGKRRPQDFALWKASKPGEPAWPSPWGAGRPGWHIECSAMASDLLGAAVDINAGGSDLAFPHHENQVAQCEAHFDCERWVRVFLHSGHLSIDGRKMSKSLKNFITVDEALREWSPSQLRFLFLLRRYSDPMEYAPNAMATAAAMHDRFKEFLTSVDIRLRETEPPVSRAGQPAAAAEAAAARVEKWGAEERALAAVLQAKRAEVHEALCDAVDTGGALRALEQLLRETNRYLGLRTPAQTSRPLLLEIGRLYGSLLRTFGVTDVPEVERYSPFGAADAAGGAGAGAGAERLVECLAAFRDDVRQLAASGADSGQLLELCDRVRDVQLRALGVRLEDRTGQPARWALATPEELAAEAAEAAAAMRDKAATRAAAQSKEAAVRAMRAVPPAAMFLPEHDGTFGRDKPFMQWDSEGLPTHGADGEPLSKGARKKAEKAHAKQKANAQDA